MTTENTQKSGWKKYLKWFATVIGIIILYNAVVGDDGESESSSNTNTSNYVKSPEGTYVYKDLAASTFTLVLNDDKTAVLTEDGVYVNRAYKGSWRKSTYNGSSYIEITYSNGNTEYIREDYIYSKLDAMAAKDYDYGFRITKK